jgi:hypothetical protein
MPGGIPEKAVSKGRFDLKFKASFLVLECISPQLAGLIFRPSIVECRTGTLQDVHQVLVDLQRLDRTIV